MRYQILLVLSITIVVYSYKLTYFDAKYAAELSRILFNIGNIEFIDERFIIQPKSDGKGFDIPDFAIAKESGEFRINMNRIPVLTLPNGIKIGQSKAIERYIAKKCNLMGYNDEEYALIDCITENIRDIREKYGQARMTGGMQPNPEKEIALKKWFDVDLKEWLIKLENSLPYTNEGYAVGNQLSYADICIWYLVTEVFDNKEAVKLSLESCNKINSIVNRVSSLPAITNYLTNRKQTRF